MKAKTYFEMLLNTSRPKLPTAVAVRAKTPGAAKYIIQSVTFIVAAKTLSNYGISIKISNDGSMQGFKMDRNKLRARPIFAIG